MRFALADDFAQSTFETDTRRKIKLRIIRSAVVDTDNRFIDATAMEISRGEGGEVFCSSDPVRSFCCKYFNEEEGFIERSSFVS